MAGSLGGLFPALSTDRLEVVSVLINDDCNLHCRHCYLQSQSPDPMREWEWERFFSSLMVDLVPSVLCFAGKEPLLDARSVGIWSETIALRNELQKGQPRKTSIGIITNGTLILRRCDSFLSTPPDYIDISIDGLPSFHDHVRGSGSFRSLEPGLRWLAERMPERIWITHTLLGANVGELPEFVEFLHHNFGLQRFSLGFYRKLPYTDPSLGVDLSISNLPLAIEQLATATLNSPIEVVIELGADQKVEEEVFRRAGWISSETLVSSNVLHFCNGLSLRVNFCSVPTGLWRAVRVSNEGHWLAAEHITTPARYSELAVTSVRECDYDARRAYESGLRSAQFAKAINPSNEHGGSVGLPRPGSGLSTSEANLP